MGEIKGLNGTLSKFLRIMYLMEKMDLIQKEIPQIQFLSMDKQNGKRINFWNRWNAW